MVCRTYSSVCLGSHHFGGQGPGCAVGGTHGAAVCPDVEVFVAIAGVAVPVTLDVIGGLVGHDGFGI
jgi:hypothetical protein